MTEWLFDGVLGLLVLGLAFGHLRFGLRSSAHPDRRTDGRVVPNDIVWHYCAFVLHLLEAPAVTRTPKTLQETPTRPPTAPNRFSDACPRLAGAVLGTRGTLQNADGR